MSTRRKRPPPPPAVSERGSLMHVCPLCRVYDPSWLVHHLGCPYFRGTSAIVRPALVAAHWRRRGPSVREVTP
jgi:hypothetical protein